MIFSNFEIHRTLLHIMRSFSSLVIPPRPFSWSPSHISIQTSTFNTHISPPPWLPCLFIAIITETILERFFKRRLVHICCCVYCLSNCPVSNIFKINLFKFEFKPSPKLIITTNFGTNVSPSTISGWEILPLSLNLK